MTPVDDTIDLRALLGTLRRQGRLVLAVLGAFLALALIYLAMVQPSYRATALVLVDPAQKNLLEPAAEVPGGAGYGDARVASEVEILRSDAVALGVVRTQALLADPEFGPALSLWQRLRAASGLGTATGTAAGTAGAGSALEEVVRNFRRAMTVTRRGKTFLIAVSVAARTPARAAELANAAVAAYIDAQVSAKIGASLAARDVLQRQIEASRRTLAEREAALDAFIAGNAARIRTETGREDIAALNATLEALAAERLAAEVALGEARAAAERQDWAALVAQLRSDALGELAAEEAALRRRLGQVVSDEAAAPDLRAELAALERRLAETAAAETGTMADALAALRRDEERARRALRESLVAGELPPDILAQVFEIQQDAAIARTQYQTLLARLRDFETQAGLQVADARVVSPALPPLEAAFPVPSLVLGLALVFGGLFGGLAGILRERFIGGFTSAEQLRDALGAPVGTVIPFQREAAPGEASIADRVVSRPLSAYAEALRRLRAAIDQDPGLAPGAAPAGGRVVAIASSLPSEGKSTTALALARTYAVGGRTVLLIDGDLRKPVLHSFVGARTEVGFEDFLRHPEKFDSTRGFASTDRLSGTVLLLGRERSRLPTDQLLTSVQFAHIVETARAKFDVVIIDTPPLLPVVDARYIVRYADTVVLMVRSGSTGQGEVRTALGQLRGAVGGQARIVGALSHHAGEPAAGYDAYYQGYHAEAPAVPRPLTTPRTAAE